MNLKDNLCKIKFILMPSKITLEKKHNKHSHSQIIQTLTGKKVRI